MVPVSISLLDMIPLFEKHYFFFGLNKNEITHVISFVHLDKLPFKLCLFALFMELESEMLERLTTGPLGADQYLAYLSDARLAKARELCTLKYKDETPEKLLLSTTFIDKLNIFLSDRELSSHLPFTSKAKGRRFFDLIERMRNQIAHGDSIFSVISEPAKMNAFIGDLRLVMASIPYARR